MCLGNYGAQMQGNLGKSVGMWLGDDDDDKEKSTPATVNVYNTLPGGDIVKAGSNRTALQTGPYSSRTERM